MFVIWFACFFLCGRLACLFAACVYRYVFGGGSSVCVCVFVCCVVFDCVCVCCVCCCVCVFVGLWLFVFVLCVSSALLNVMHCFVLLCFVCCSM